MQRIDTLTAVHNKFGPGKHGFGDGDVQTGSAPTRLNAAWCDGVQEALARVIEGVDWLLDPSNHNQLYEAICFAISRDSSATTAALDAHVKDHNNPHKVTPALIGAASDSALQAHVQDRNNPHQVTPALIGAASDGALQAHVNDHKNPHKVTPALIGAASDSALQAHVNDHENPHGISFTQSFSENGWCRLPNGLLIQWGVYRSPASWEEGTGPRVVFPIAFPNACFPPVISDLNNNTGNSGWNMRDSYAQLTGWDHTAFTTFLQWSAGAERWDGLTYLAVGY